MILLNKINITLSLSIVCLLSAMDASAQSVVRASEYSLLPETMVSPPDQTPNIVIIMDTSSSMRFNSSAVYAPVIDADIDGTARQPGGAASPDSRSFRVREGILAALEKLNTDNIPVNIAMATFGNSGLSFSGPNVGSPIPSLIGSPISNCRGYDLNCVTHTDNQDHVYNRTLTGRGTMLTGLSPLNNTLLSDLKVLLATEPESPDFNPSAPSTNLVETSGRGYFEVVEPNAVHSLTGNSNLLYDGVLTSQGSTPLRGSLSTVGTYYTGVNELGVASSLDANEQPSTPIVPPTPLSLLVAGASTACVPNTYIFLLTDGEPTFRPDKTTAPDISVEVTAVATEAKRLRDSYGIQTWVFGFELGTTEKAFMETIADGGSATQNAFLSSSANDLRDQIVNAIKAIDTLTASSSGISVVASQSEGAGLVVQALYDPKLEKDITVGGVVEKQVAFWTGSLNGVFLDEFGFLREDSDGDAVLDDYATDNAFRMVFNGGTQQIDVERLSIAADGTETVSSTVTLSDIKPIWDADEVLSSYSDNAVYGSIQRPYNTVASDTDGYRHIFSWMADDPNDLDALHVGSQLEFMFTDDAISKTINAKNFLMFDPRSVDAADQKIEVSEIIRFIRGEEGIAGLRSRTLGTEKFLLGDIVHSNATQVGAPSSSFDFQGDDSYTEFKETYENRRRMVYVGANDGMLHGFNAGFWDPTNKQFHRSPHVVGEIGAAHDLGAEVWAYAPMNLLPHLKFLSESTYSSNIHVAYMDGPVQSFDIRAWDENDIDHVNGWGTIIVAGMRFGGGDYTDLDWDAVDGTNTAFTSRSGYVILDVTDPEQEPKVIAEVIHPSMGFSLSEPSVSRTNCAADADGDLTCEWHLVIGSGPTELSTSTSTQLPRVFRYKLDHNAWGFESYTVGGIDEQFKAFGSDNASTGDLSIVDWNSDYEHDVVYFGSISGTELAATGGVHRFQLNGANANTITTLVDTDKPVPYRPVARRQAGVDWVSFGTGRFLTIDDATSIERNWFYSVIEPRDADGEFTYPSALNASTELVNVTDIDVSSTDGSLSATVEGAETFGELKAYILDSSSAKNRGWRKQLDAAANASNPSRKVSASPLSFRNFLFYTDYLPPVSDADACTNEFGSSFLNVVDIATGTASYVNSPDFDGPLGVEAGVDKNITTTIILGDGYATQSYIFPRKNPGTGKPEVLIKTPLSTGAIKDTVLALPPQFGGRTSWRELEIQ